MTEVCIRLLQAKDIPKFGLTGYLMVLRSLRIKTRFPQRFFVSLITI